MLSAENIWQIVPKSNAEKYAESKEVQYRFYNKEGDHITFIEVYKEWVKNGSSQQWCYDHYINYRSLVQASEIKYQLKKISYDVSLSGFTEKHILKDAKNSLKSVSEKIRLCLCIGFFMNAGRAIASGHEGSYLSIKDHSMMHIDANTSISALQEYPKWIVYTHFSGNSLSHGTIKMLSKVKSSWLDKLVPKIEKADINKLMGINNPKRPREDNEVPAMPQINVTDKIEQAKQRYLKRKLND